MKSKDGKLMTDEESVSVPDQGCAGPVAYIIRGALRRGLATFATPTGAIETVEQKHKLSRSKRGYRMAVLTA